MHMCDLESAFAGYIGIDLIVHKLYKEVFKKISDGLWNEILSDEKGPVWKF